jgi:hypothetical protein
MRKPSTVVATVKPPRKKAGVFANAFRIVPDNGDELLLDFCVFSQQDQQVDVVSRVRVHHTLLPQLQKRIEDHIKGRKATPLTLGTKGVT